MIKDRTSALGRSLGGSGIALRDPYSLNNLNPASYTSIEPVTQVTELGLFFESANYRNTQESASFQTGNITNLNFWVKFSKRWSGTIGVSPFSSVKYNIVSGRRLSENSTLQYSGSGGVSQFYFGNGFKITKNLSIGITGSFLHGSIDRNETISSGLGTNTQMQNSTYITGGNLDFGLQYQFLLKNDRSLTLGAVYDDPLTLRTYGDRYIFQASDTISSENISLGDYILPAHYGVGISFQTPRSTITGDVSYRDWSKAHLDDGLILRSTRRLSFGYQYNGNPGADGYLGSVILRTGGYIQENYLVLENVPFTDWGVTFGIGLPSANNRGIINLSYSFNQSGTVANNLISQQAHVIALDLTFRDLWGIKRRFD